MRDTILHEEKFFSRVMTLVFACITVVFLLLFIHGLLTTGNAVLVVLFFCLFLVFAMITLNFTSFQVVITPGFIKFGYRFSNRIARWEQVEKYQLDDVSSARYGGFGVRFGRVDGNWRIIYSIPNRPRIVLSLKQGRLKQAVFSTENPGEVMKLLKQQVGK